MCNLNYYKVSKINAKSLNYLIYLSSTVLQLYGLNLPLKVIVNGVLQKNSRGMAKMHPFDITKEAAKNTDLSNSYGKSIVEKVQRICDCYICLIGNLCDLVMVWQTFANF